MPKKNMKESIQEKANVFDRISGKNTREVPDAQNTQDVQDAPKGNPARATRQKEDKVPLSRLNLKIPAEIKEYLTIAAAKASIEQKRQISLTEYLCNLVKADQQKQAAKEFKAALNKNKQEK